MLRAMNGGGRGCRGPLAQPGPAACPERRARPRPLRRAVRTGAAPRPLGRALSCIALCIGIELPVGSRRGSARPCSTRELTSEGAAAGLGKSSAARGGWDEPQVHLRCNKAMLAKLEEGSYQC